MRQAAQMKMGFYPCPPEVAGRIAGHLDMPYVPGQVAGPDFTILDPCCGEGIAVRTIAEALGIPHANVYGVELDGNRGRRAQEAMPEAHVLAATSFHGTGISPGGFSIVYCNPPFDDEIGGGKRDELTFYQNAHGLLAESGVFVAVMPRRTLEDGPDARRFFAALYRDVRVFAFPEEHRHFREVVLIGHKRREPVRPTDDLPPLRLHRNSPLWDALPAVGSTADRWTPVPGRAPRRFLKTDFTEPELIAALEASPLERLFDAPEPVPARRPPMPPGQGHVALHLAGGGLTGGGAILAPRGEDPHVVRGSARKEQYVADVAVQENPDQSTTTKTTLSERIVLTVRAVGPDGVIRTLE